MTAEREITAKTLLAALLEGAPCQAVEAGPGDLVVWEGTLLSRRTLFICFDYGRNQGSIGTLEAQQIVASLAFARRISARVALIIESSGIRVTDSTAGIASLRQVMRAAADSRLAGVRMLAMVTQCAYGGASMLASICERRLIHPGTLLSMSGPRLIQQNVGAEAFDASDPAAVSALMGGAARAATAPDFVLVPTLQAYRLAFTQWLRSDAGPTLGIPSLQSATNAMLARLPQADAPLPPEPELDAHALALLQTVLPEFDRPDRLTGHLALATRQSNAGLRVLILQAPEGATATDVLALTQAIQQPFPQGAEERRITILLNAESHSAHPQDERAVLSELLANLVLSMRAAHCQGTFLHVIVTGRTGGGIMAALSSGASLVSMAAHARLAVLPRAALQSLKKMESPEAGSIAMALEVGAVDQPIE